MKKSLLMVFLWSLLLFPFSRLMAQEDKSMRPSPPAEAHATVNGSKVSIYYSSPAVKGRTIWGSLVPYGEVWRTGANEATIFETSSDVMIQGKKLPAGKYSLWTIAGEKEWTFIFNSKWDVWGTQYPEGKDVLRVTAVPEKSKDFNERMKFDISDHVVTLMWEKLKVSFMLR